MTKKSRAERRAEAKEQKAAVAAEVTITVKEPKKKKVSKNGPVKTRKATKEELEKAGVDMSVKAQKERKAKAAESEKKAKTTEEPKKVKKEPTPNNAIYAKELAIKVGIEPVALRKLLRKQFPKHPHGTAWIWQKGPELDALVKALKKVVAEK